MEEREADVHHLARRFTQQSNPSTVGQDLFAAEPESALNPNGENFDVQV